MASTGLLCIAIISLVGMVFYYDGVEGKKLTRKDYKDIDEQLKLLNKPFVKTIKTEHGDMYDCVDFYKQPAFDHPLLKNHSFHPQMRPSSSPNRARPRSGAKHDSKIVSSRFSLDCPKNTVPIRRVTRDDLIRIKALTKQFASRTVTPNGIQAKYGTHFAMSQSKASPKPRKFRGVRAMLSIYNPRVSSSQHSSGKVIIQNGFDSLQSGWMVNPKLYNDNRTHGFIYLNTKSSRCFNILCPGFIAVRSDITVDESYENRSRRGGPVYADTFFIYQDEKSGHWWLEVTKDGIQIGFWPKQIFSNLQDSGSYIACGGEVYSPDGEKTPMGTEYKPVFDTRKDAFCANFAVVNDAHKLVTPTLLEDYADDASYAVADVGNTDTLGHLILYGGPFT